MSTSKKNPKQHLPSAAEVQQALSQIESMDDFFGKEGVFVVDPIPWTEKT